MKHRIFTTEFSKVYPMYVQKAERKGRTRDEVDGIISWLTGYTTAGLQDQIERKNDFETFFAQAPALNPNVALIKGHRVRCPRRGRGGSGHAEPPIPGQAGR